MWRNTVKRKFCVIVCISGSWKGKIYNVLKSIGVVLYMEEVDVKVSMKETSVTHCVASF